MTTSIQATCKEIFVKGFERVLRIEREDVGLLAYIALHDTTLGPALGGVRIFSYEKEEDALQDVLRLSEGMTIKSLLSGCRFGGGKGVIVLKKGQKKTKELVQAFAEVVDDLGGQYISAKDLGCDSEDLAYMQEKTPFIVGVNHEKSSKDPALFTTWGVFRGIEATLKARFADPTIKGKRILIQGVGSVGEKLVNLLFWRGAELYIYDIDEEKMKRLQRQFDLQLVSKKDLFSTECDIFSPCATGGVLNRKSIQELGAKAVAGAANNQLLQEEDAELLHKRGILYAPDFVINAGGLINVSEELVKEGYSPKRALSRVDDIADRLAQIYHLAEKEKISTLQAAHLLAKRLLETKEKSRETIYFHHKDHQLRVE